MVFVIVWFLDHFTPDYVPLMNSIQIMTSVGLFHTWVTKFKAFFIFFKLSILTSNKVIWVGLLAILFDETQHVVKISTTGYVPVCPWCFSFVNSRAVIWLPFSLMAYWCFFCILFVSCCRKWRSNALQQCFLKSFAFGCWLEIHLIHISPHHWCKYRFL